MEGRVGTFSTISSAASFLPGISKLRLEIRKSQDLAKDLGGTASQSGEENLSIKNCELYTET